MGVMIQNIKAIDSIKNLRKNNSEANTALKVLRSKNSQTTRDIIADRV